MIYVSPLAARSAVQGPFINDFRTEMGGRGLDKKEDAVREVGGFHKVRLQRGGGGVSPNAKRLREFTPINQATLRTRTRKGGKNPEIFAYVLN